MVSKDTHDRVNHHFPANELYTVRMSKPPDMRSLLVCICVYMCEGECVCVQIRILLFQLNTHTELRAKQRWENVSHSSSHTLMLLATIFDYPSSQTTTSLSHWTTMITQIKSFTMISSHKTGDQWKVHPLTKQSFVIIRNQGRHLKRPMKISL